MKLAFVERLDNLVTAAQRLQRILDAERPDLPYPVSVLVRVGIDVDAAVSQMQRHVEAIGVGRRQQCEPARKTAGVWLRFAWRRPRFACEDDAAGAPSSVAQP
jgi:hypothetical protein